MFAPVRQSADCLGPILPAIAARTGLRQDTPVLCGIHDSNASLLPHLLRAPAAFRGRLDRHLGDRDGDGGAADELDPARDTLINVNAFGDPVPSARFMGGREHAMLTEGLNEGCTANDAAAVLTKRIFLLPSVLTGHGPFPHRTAAWVNDDAIRPGERRAATSFYLAVMTATCLKLIGADGSIIADGPFANNELYVRMLAAATGRGVIVAKGTRAGAALLTSQAVSLPPHDGEFIESPGRLWSDYARDWHAAL